jgi:DnaJ-class molecular chaperone
MFQNNNVWTEPGEHHKMFGKARMPDRCVDLELTLEQLCHAHSVHYTIKRRVEDEWQRATTQEVPVEIPVKAGWNSGTKITFEGHGDETFLRAAGNVVFVVKELPHAVYKRRGADLRMHATITLEQALNGGTVEFADIVSGARRRTTFGPLASSREKLRVPRYGMPVLNSDKERGALLVKFNIALIEK